MEHDEPMRQRQFSSAHERREGHVHIAKVPAVSQAQATPRPYIEPIHDAVTSASCDDELPIKTAPTQAMPSAVIANHSRDETYTVSVKTPAVSADIANPTAEAANMRMRTPSTYGAQRRWAQTRRIIPGRLPPAFALVLLVLVLAIIAVPLLQRLAAIQRLDPGVARSFTPAVPSAATQGTPNRHVFDWVTQAQNAAQIAYVNQMLSHMTLDEKIGQMIMIEFNESQMTDGLAYEISHYHIGSVVLYAYNVVNPNQARTLDQAIQANAKIPVLISTDQEGGTVNRLATIIGPLPSAAMIGATNDPAYAKQRGEQDAKALYSIGINANLAPVVDVLNTPTGGAIGDRAFGSTPQQVTKMAGAYLTGLQESQQVVGCLKHFPGLGAVEQDPHRTLTTLNRDLGTLEQIDWAPYASLIATGQVDMVMVTHVIMPAVDPDRPASLSKPMITGILRDQLHFNGVVMTDGIYMKALAAHYSFDQIVLYAVEAGVDIVSSTYSLQSTDEAFNVIKNAVLDGTLSQKQIDDSVRRILLTKLRHGILAGQPAK